MQFEIKQVIEIIDGIPKVLSTQVKSLDTSEDLYQMACDLMGDFSGLTPCVKSQYTGFRGGDAPNLRKRYRAVIFSSVTRNTVIIAADPEFFANIKFLGAATNQLFPYMVEVEISSRVSLNEFFSFLEVRSDV